MTTADQGPAGTSYFLTVGSERFDPADTVDPADLTVFPDDSARADRPDAGAADASGPADTRIVQFHQALVAAEMDQLRDDYGLSLSSYLPPHAYVERVPAAVRPRLAAAPLVRAVAPYLPAYKLGPVTVPGGSTPQDGDPASGTAAATRVAAEAELTSYGVLLFDQGDPAVVTSALDAMGASDVAVFDNRAAGGYLVVSFRAPAGVDLTSLTQLPDVRWVEAVGENRATTDRTDTEPASAGIGIQVVGGNTAAAGVHQSRNAGNRVIWNRGIHGEDQIVAVVDNGRLDDAHDFFSDAANQPGQNHRKLRYLTPAALIDVHPTAVAGVVAGDDVNNPGVHPDRGGAWAATIVDQDWVLAVGLFQRFLHSSQRGARIHSNSWVQTTYHYSVCNAELDRFTWLNEDDLVVASAPNTGQQPAFGGPCLSKNAVCVVATQDHVNFNIFGSGLPGPTWDGRRKPDLAAIGGGMDVALANLPINPQATNAMWNIPGSHTSLATPHVSAAAALIRQYFTQGYYPTGNASVQHRRTPTAALLKAMLVASCEELNAGAGNYPNNQVGWGLIKLNNVMPAPTAARQAAVFDVRRNNGVVAGAVPRIHQVDLAAGQPLRVVLAYTDAEHVPTFFPPPGLGLPVPRMLVNNLNLKVTDPNGQVYRGNDLAGGFSRAGGGVRDDDNPVEVVQVAVPVAGRWTIEIEATAVPVGRQGYAVVVLAGFAAGQAPAAVGITLGGLMAQTGRALQPVAARVAPVGNGGGGNGNRSAGAGVAAVPSLDLAELRLLMAEMGLPDAATVLASAGVLAPVTEVVTGILDLPDALSALAEADAAGDEAAVAAAVAGLGPRLRAVVDSVRSLSTAFHDAADGGVPGDVADQIRDFAADFPRRFFGYVLADHLDREHVTTAGVARLFGLIESTPVAATGHVPAHTRRTVRFDRFGEVLTDPFGVLAQRYGWGSDQLDAAGLFEGLAGLLAGVDDAFVEPDPVTGSPVLKLGPVDVGLTPDAGAGAAELRPGIRVRLAADFPASPDFRIPLGPGLTVEIAVDSDLEPDLTLDLRPPADVILTPPSVTDVHGRVRIGISATGADGGPLVLVGRAGGSRIEAAELRAAVGAELEWDPSAGVAAGAFLAEVAIQGGRAVLSLGAADSFLRTLLPGDGLELDFDLLLGWSQARGLYFDGGAGVAIDLPAGFTVGPVRINSLHLGLVLDPSGLGLYATGSVSTHLGPVTIDVEPMGATAALTEAPGGGNLGVADFDVAWQPPTGLGFSINAGLAKGGGFLYYDQATHEYSGALELKLGPVSVKALGILTTELPDGAEGWALLLLLFSEFKGIQLGFGFTLDGVGGIIGLQHGVNAGPLRSGLRSGALDAVLFPADPVGDAPELLDRLRTVFPIVPRALTVGPALKIGWGTPPLVTIKLGVVLQFDDVLGAASGPPTLARVLLLGQLLLLAPPRRRGSSSAALLQLKVDLLGEYDADAKTLAIDAVLYDSHVGFASLSGTMVVRARFGDRPNLIAAVGGFHPRFTDIPPGVPQQQRAGFRLDYGPVKIQVLGYVALTTNTFQVGADASLEARGGNFRVTATLGFDALFILEPVFRFDIGFRVDARIKWRKWTLASIRVEGAIAGPGRWSISGSASLKIMFWRPKIRFSSSWGSTVNIPSSSVDVGAALVDALNRPEAWSAALPQGEPLVTLLPPAPEAGVVAHPLSQLVVTQTVVPLGIRIDRLGQDRPSGERTFTIDSVEIGDRTEAPRYHREHFARGQYLELSDSQKLSTPSFESFDAGARVSSDAYAVDAGETVGFDPGWETGYLDPDLTTTVDQVDGALLADQVRFAPASRSPLRSRFPRTTIEVSVDDDQSFVTDPDPAATIAATARARAGTGVVRAARLTQLAGSGAERLSYTLAAQRAERHGGTVTELAELVTR
jgi:hypothetical protein